MLVTSSMRLHFQIEKYHSKDCKDFMDYRVLKGSVNRALRSGEISSFEHKRLLYHLQNSELKACELIGQVE